MSQTKHYACIHNHQIVECTNLKEGGPCSSGRIVFQGYDGKGNPKGQPVGYHSDAWANFDNTRTKNWIPVKFP